MTKTKIKFAIAMIGAYAYFTPCIAMQDGNETPRTASIKRMQAWVENYREQCPFLQSDVRNQTKHVWYRDKGPESTIRITVFEAQELIQAINSNRLSVEKQGLNIAEVAYNAPPVAPLNIIGNPPPSTINLPSDYLDPYMRKDDQKRQ